MHELPTWFLWTALFFPRLALFIGWHDNWAFPWPQPWLAVSWFFLPRILVLAMIYGVSGVCGWFWAHLAVMFIVFAGGRSQTKSS